MIIFYKQIISIDRPMNSLAFFKSRRRHQDRMLLDYIQSIKDAISLVRVKTKSNLKIET